MSSWIRNVMGACGRGLMHPLFPSISRNYIEQCQFSSWYPTFCKISPRATIIRPLSAEFRQYLEEDGVTHLKTHPSPATSSLSDESSSDTEDNFDADELQKNYSFPELDARIRAAITRYGAVFPKLNWTSPKDASWILPTLKCTSPVDVYLLLKSSDFVLHDLDPLLAFEGCSVEADQGQSPVHELELVLKKWYAIDHGREFRCFVRNETLLGISQRDDNYYPYLNEDSTKAQVLSTSSAFWATQIKGKFKGGGHYIFDIHLTRDLSSAHLLDINPYHRKTDSLLFTFDELLELFIATACESPTFGTNQTALSNPITPVLRIIESPSDPAAKRNSPAYQHNAIPFDALNMSTGRDIDSFTSQWEEELKRTLDDNERAGTNGDVSL